MHVIARPINTTTRRLRAGAEVAETDDLTPHTFADLKERGFIAARPDGEESTAGNLPEVSDNAAAPAAPRSAASASSSRPALAADFRGD